MENQQQAFNRAVAIVGSQVKMARAIDRSSTVVYQMQRGIRPVPASICHAIEAATGGEVGRLELKPRDYEKLWPELVKS